MFRCPRTCPRVAGTAKHRDPIVVARRVLVHTQEVPWDVVGGGEGVSTMIVYLGERETERLTPRSSEPSFDGPRNETKSRGKCNV